MSEKKVILHVEDDPSITEIVKTVLEKYFDVKVLSAKSIEEGWKIYQRNFLVINAIILDGNLPDGTSDKLAENIRSFGFVGNMMANSGDDEMNKKMVCAGCNMSAKKPTGINDYEKVLK